MQAGPQRFLKPGICKNQSTTMKPINSSKRIRHGALIALTGLFSIAFASYASAQAGQHRVDNVDIKISSQPTPQFSVSGPRDKQVRPQNWIEIEAELSLQTTNKSEFIDELHAGFFVVIDDVETNRKVVLTTDIVFVDVKASGRNSAIIVAYLSPWTMQKLTGGTNYSERSLEAVAIRISGPGFVNDKVEVTALENARFWERMDIPRHPGQIMRKDQTPFASLWWDRYPRTKDEG